MAELEIALDRIRITDLEKQLAEVQADIAYQWYTIRCSDRAALVAHREEMRGMGFMCEAIECSRGWRTEGLPVGKFFFVCKILQHRLTAQMQAQLVQWDQEHGE